MKEGYLFSSLLFNIALEILSSEVRQEKEIRGSSRLTDTENKLAVTSGERDRRARPYRVGDKREKSYHGFIGNHVCKSFENCNAL